MVKIDEYEYEVLGNGVCYGYLPKVDSEGLLIIRKLYNGKWDFLFPPDVLAILEVNNTYNFQVWDGTELEWFHGVVDNKGHITQIG